MPDFHTAAGDTIAVFLRKQAPTLTAARNEAEYLRLLLHRDAAASAPSALEPFALIVEDEQDTADAYREAPDLIVLDYRLPDLHGRELCRRLRANPDTGRVPILVVTASPQDNSDSDGPDAVLTKPCLLPTLLAASRLLLRGVMPAPPQPPASAT